MKALLRLALVIVSCFPVALSFAGCASQGEGQRCDIRNANADCQDGLLCNTALLPQAESQGLCCPPSGSTVPACIQGLVSVPGTGGSGGAEAGSSEASGVDTGGAPDAAPVDAAVDAPSADEASDDASVDAAGDAGDESVDAASE